MNLANRFWMGAVSLCFAACAASGEGPADADGVEITPTASTSSPSTASPADTAVKRDPAPAGACPYFCGPRNGTCSRPKIADADLGKLTCGQYSMGRFEGMEREECPAECCPARKDGPAGDKDADGILDVNDKCPDAPEDVDGNTDWDGCADPDNDKDGLDDVKDQCCYVAEDADGKEDLDGCPEP
jgi:hypothetical protein